MCVSQEPLANSVFPLEEPKANSDSSPPAAKLQVDANHTPPPKIKPKANSVPQTKPYHSVSGNSGGWRSADEAEDDILAMVRWFKNANNKCPHNWRKDACKRFSRLWERILGFRPIKKWWGEDYFKVREATAELLALYIGFLSKTQERRREALVIGDETIHRGDYFILLFHLNMALFLVCNYLVFTFSAFRYSSWSCCWVFLGGTLGLRTQSGSAKPPESQESQRGPIRQECRSYGHGTSDLCAKSQEATSYQLPAQASGF